MSSTARLTSSRRVHDSTEKMREHRSWTDETSDGHNASPLRREKFRGLIFLPNVLLVLCLTIPSCCAFLDAQRYAARWMMTRQSSRALSVALQETTTPLPLDSQALPARYLAVDALIERKGSFALDKLESLMAQSELSTRDRSFARLLVTECSRRLGQIDRVLDMCETKKTDTSRQNKNSSKREKQRKHVNTTDRFIQAVLRIGAVQLLFLGTPAHAAVKETVDLLRLPKHLHIPEAKIKFVNAVLRRLTREGDILLAETDVTDNAAPWLVGELTQAWGVTASRGIIEAAMRESPRYLTIKQGGHSHQEDEEVVQHVAGHFVDSTVLPQGSLLISHPPAGKISDWPLYNDGQWWLQDVSATLPAIVLYNILKLHGQVDQQHVVDLCAAPGGKTAQLCSFGFGNVTAVEISSRRSRRLKENIQRLNLDCQVVIADSTEWMPGAKANGVLIDAPCTATGTGSKRPDVLRKDPNHEELLETQYKLLCHAADNCLAPGGVMVYATCSLLPRENEEQIQKFLSTRDAMKTLPIGLNEIVGFEECIDENGWLRVIPGTQPSTVHPVDGFFVARLQRTR